MLATAGCQQPATDAGPDPKNEIPFGFVESPASPPGESASVKKQLAVTGWALDDQGVKEVRLFVDNKFVARTTTNQLRPDVSKVNPNYATSNQGFHGWVITTTLGSVFAAGAHTLVVQAVDTQGATRDIGTISVMLEP